MIIPHEHLSAAALRGLIEEFITREGTDYGAYEIDLEQKVEQVQRQIQRREVVIVYDFRTESVSLLTRDAAEQFMANEALANQASVESVTD